MKQQTGVFSNKQILEALNNGQIIIHPLIKDNIAGSSVDVTLGEYYYTTEHNTASNFYNPFSEDEVKQYFNGPHKAKIHKDWAKKANANLLENIDPDHPIIILRPGQRILAHTHEFIGIHPPGTSTMQSRSTWGRNGITVCLDAGWGDPGYINRWTMEVYNLNQTHSIALPVGERIAQIVFHHTGEVEKSYDKLSGKYQSGSDIKDLIKNWSPEQMLPRAYKDKRSQLKEL